MSIIIAFDIVLQAQNQRDLSKINAPCIVCCVYHLCVCHFYFFPDVNITKQSYLTYKGNVMSENSYKSK